MYMNLSVELTPGQKDFIKKQVEDELMKAIENEALLPLVRDVVKAQMRCIVNEEIQTKGYRKMLSDRISKLLFQEIKE